MVIIFARDETARRLARPANLEPSLNQVRAAQYEMVALEQPLRAADGRHSEVSRKAKY